MQPTDAVLESQSVQAAWAVYEACCSDNHLQRSLPCNLRILMLLLFDPQVQHDSKLPLAIFIAEHANMLATVQHSKSVR